MVKYLLDIDRLVKMHENWRMNRCINLIPSENITSERVRRYLASDLGHRYSLKGREVPEFLSSENENFYCGTKYIEEIEKIGEDLAQRIFKCRYAFLQPLSGHIAGMIVLVALARRGDSIMFIDVKDGGYPGYTYVSQYFGLKGETIPFDLGRFNIEYDRFEKEVFKVKPKLVILGASSILFPYNLKRVRETCDKVDAYIGYDASHVLGLIAGKMFQPDPFKNGVDILFGSTHKTFFGPQGGMILTDNDDIAEKILRNMKLKMLDNPHLNRIVGLVQALWEFLMYGEKYARQVVYNAKALGKYLDANNIPVKYGELGYTESHQILLNIEKIEEKSGLKYSQIARKMEEANIIIDLGGRIGTQEISRIGMKEKDMKLIANLFSEIVIEKKSIDIVRKKVLNIRGKFTKICYC